MNIAAPLQLLGDPTTTLAITSSTDLPLTLSAIGSTGTVTGVGMAGTIIYSGFEALTVTQQQKNNMLTVDATVVQTTVNAPAGGEAVTVNATENPLILNFGTAGTGGDSVHIFGAGASVTVNGAGGSDLLTLDDSAATAPITASIGGGNTAGATVSGMFTGAVSFTNLGTVVAELGSGNDLLTLNNSLATTVLDLFGNGGNDTFTVNSAGSAPVAINGGGQQDVAILEIPGAPGAASDFRQRRRQCRHPGGGQPSEQCAGVLGARQRW